MAVGTGFGQVFKGIGKEIFSLKRYNRSFGKLNIIYFISYQVKLVELLFHQPFSSQD